MSIIAKLGQFFISVSDDGMVATLHIDEELSDSIELPINEEILRELLQKSGVTYGLKESAIQAVTTTQKADLYPIDIAIGKEKIDGTDAKVDYHVEFLREIITETEDYDFRNVMKIPSVEKDEKLATVIPATKGVNGKDVFGADIVAISGKESQIKAGKNVRFEEGDLSFYATYSGEAKLKNNRFEVQSIYEVNDSISLKTGNIDFVGSVIIHGDVPSGYTIKAKGDIKVNGLVEAADLRSGGSIYISEGFSGMKKGTIFAKENLYVGYVNQGTVDVGKSIIVENSILHSNCKATNKIACRNGNIIGGVIQAGDFIEAKDIGNRLNTKTKICFGLENDLQEELKKYKSEQTNLNEAKEKLVLLGKQIENRDTAANPKVRIALLRQRNRLELIHEELLYLEDKMRRIEKLDGLEQKGRLFVRQYLYPNTIIAFGKYEETIQSDYYAVEVRLTNHEIKFINR